MFTPHSRLKHGRLTTQLETRCGRTNTTLHPLDLVHLKVHILMILMPPRKQDGNLPARGCYTDINLWCDLPVPSRNVAPDPIMLLHTDKFTCDGQCTRRWFTQGEKYLLSSHSILILVMRRENAPLSHQVSPCRLDRRVVLLEV